MTHKAINSGKWNNKRSINEAWKTGFSNMCILTLFSAKCAFWNCYFDKNFFDFEFHGLPAYDTTKYIFSIFVASTIAFFVCEAIKVAVFVYL